MKAQEARMLGQEIREAILANDKNKAVALLDPILGQRTPFRLLDLIGDRGQV